MHPLFFLIGNFPTSFSNLISFCKHDIILSDAAAKLRVLLSENPSDTKTSYLAWVRAQNRKIAREICKYQNIYSSYLIADQCF